MTTEADDIILLTYDEAVALLPEGERVHTFLDSPVALLGADWDREDVLTLLRSADRREVTGPAAQAMGHGLAAFRPDGTPVFIATAPEGSEADGTVRTKEAEPC